MKKHQRDKLSQFEIALEKGDYKLPSEIPTKWTIYDVIKVHIILRRVLDYPGDKEHDWMIVLIAHDGDIKRTALELGIEIWVMYKRMERLDKFYQVHRPMIC